MRDEDETIALGTHLTCPKCGGVMRTHARNGVEIEQCHDCRGLFLDVGEFERLMAAESSLLGAPRI